MADLKVNVAFTVRLAASEFRLVGLALAGKLHKQDDVCAARDLNARLMTSREQQLQEAADSAELAAGQAEDAAGGIS